MRTSEKKTKKYFLNTSQLKNGDVILTANNGIFSTIIKKTIKSDFSHALMMVNDTAYIHASPDFLK